MFSPSTTRSSQRGFTLLELVVVMLIILILASISMVTLVNVQETAKLERTRAQIAKINALIGNMWQEYRTRRPSVAIPPGTSPFLAARMTLDGRRELMRMEMPDRKTDITSNPVVLTARPALSKAYQARVPGGWTEQYQGSECLYLILSMIEDGETNGLAFLRQEEIADLDGDGMPEILDGWGNPIRFLRWAPGFRSRLQDGVVANGRDQFDPLKTRGENFAIWPLIVSAGADGEEGIAFDGSSAMTYASSNPPNDPYVVVGGSQLGADLVSGNTTKDDNIDNHRLATELQ